MTQFNVKQQPLSVLLPPLSTVAMGTTSLELTDTHPIETTSVIKTSAVNIDSGEDDVIGRTITYKNKTSRSFKISLFYKRYIKLLKLVVKSIIPDLKSFKKWQILVLILFATFNVVFSILDFNSFFSKEKKRSLLKWVNDLEDGKPLWRRICLCLSGIAAFTNVLNVLLVIKGKLSSYFWGIIGAISYGIYAFAYSYVGDAQLYILFFLPMQFIGVYIWSRELDNQATTRVKSLKFLGWIFVIVLSVGLGVLFYYEIPAFSKLLTSQYYFETMAVPHIFDASTNALSVVGQFLLIFCYWEQYILWIGVNIMGIIMYSGLLQTDRDINLLVVWFVFIINSIVGLWTWFRRWKYANKTMIF